MEIKTHDELYKYFALYHEEIKSENYHAYCKYRDEIYAKFDNDVAEDFWKNTIVCRFMICLLIARKKRYNNHIKFL